MVVDLPVAVVQFLAPAPSNTWASRVAMAEQAQIDDLEAQPQLVEPVGEAMSQPGQLGQPQPEVSWALTKSDRVQWCWYSVAWLFCVLFFPLGIFIWCTIACNHFCQPREVQEDHPADRQVAKAALVTASTWCGVFLLLCLACGIFKAHSPSYI